MKIVEIGKVEFPYVRIAVRKGGNMVLVDGCTGVDTKAIRVLEKTGSIGFVV